MLRAVLAISALLGPLAPLHLKRRLAKGKEDPDRWQEKLGIPSHPRPDGPLVWMHGVGVGEVMALRGLIERLSYERPDLNFLVTSSARSSGDVFAKNLPPRTIHQYLPLDMPRPVAAFLDHWQPDLAVWSDQDIWPRMAVTVARRSIPQALVAARITEKSARAKARFGAAFGDLYRLLDTRHAQDDTTYAALRGLMDDTSAVHVTGSIKAASAPLASNPKDDTQFRQIAAKRMIWLNAPSHSEDEQIALKAHKRLLETDPDALLIIAPRDIARAQDVCGHAEKLGLSVQARSTAPLPDAETNVYIADTYGELGTWYSIADIALVGGTFGPTEGHNPWEAIALGCGVLHGPGVANFARDYDHLASSDGVRRVMDDTDILRALRDPAMQDVAKKADIARAKAADGLDKITADLLGLLKV